MVVKIQIIFIQLSFLSFKNLSEIYIYIYGTCTDPFYNRWEIEYKLEIKLLINEPS